MAVRTFLALDIDRSIQDRLAEFQQKLAACEAKGRLVAPENLHVTLHFLGDVADEMTAEVCEMVEAVAGQLDPFDFEVKGIRCVPPGGRPRMIWAGVDDPAGQMASLHEALGEALGGLGVRREERGFKPHLTLIRFKLVRNVTQVHSLAAEHAETLFGTRHAGEVCVYSSQLTPRGPVYSRMAAPPLGR